MSVFRMFMNEYAEVQGAGSFNMLVPPYQNALCHIQKACDIIEKDILV
jgi:hypothetical protein